MNQGPNNMNQGPNNMNQGPNNMNQGPNNMNQGGSDFGQPGSNFNQGSNNFNQGSNNFNQGGTDLSQGVNDPNQSGTNSNQGSNNFNQGATDLSQPGSNFNQGSNDYSGRDSNQGGSNFNQGPNDFNQGGNSMNQGGTDFNQPGTDQSGLDLSQPNSNFNQGASNSNQGYNPNFNQNGQNSNFNQVETTTPSTYIDLSFIQGKQSGSNSTQRYNQNSQNNPNINTGPRSGFAVYEQTTPQTPSCPIGQVMKSGCDDSSWQLNTNNGMCLKFIDSLYTFAKAISVCGAEGGKMVVTKTSTDSNYAMNLHTAESSCSSQKPDHCKFWLGLRYVQNQHYWNDQRPLDQNGYSLWSADTPNDPTGLDCVTSGPGMWNMVNCQTERATVMCEKQSEKICRPA